MDSKCKNYVYLILSERVMLFSVNHYINDLTLDAINFLYEWKLLKNGKIVGNVRCLNDFLKDEIAKMSLEITEYSKKHNMKLYFFDNMLEVSDFSEYLEDEEKFIKKVTSYCKRFLTKAKEVSFSYEESNLSKNEFDGFFCLHLTGEQKEEILKKIAIC